MKPITIEMLNDYHYLSSLGVYGGNLLYVDTMTDKENNNYRQTLHSFDPVSRKDTVLYTDKRVSYTVTSCGRIMIKDGSDNEDIKSVLSFLNEDGTKTEALRMWLAAGKISDVSDKYLLVEATVDVKCPDYHKLDETGRKAYADAKKKDEDYIVLDEYPFFYNGAGFINGTRNGLFLVDKKTGEANEIVPYTMDVESVVVNGNKVYILGNNYESMKDLFSSVYEYDLETGVLSTVYANDNTMYLRRLALVNGELFAIGSVGSCICGQSFYTFKDGKPELRLHTEWMLNNAVCTDCHYGALNTNQSHDEKYYLVNTVEECSYVFSFDGKELVKLTEGMGSVDAIVFIEDQMYALAMQDMKLQEIYKVNGAKLEQLSDINTAALSDYYVAWPEELRCFNVDEIHGLVLKPMNYDPNKTYPMILDIHGGPKASYGPVFYHEMQVWAGMGYFVVYCNPHCSDGRGDDFSDYIKHYGSTDYFDIMKFVDTVLETYPNIDKDNLAVTGGSYGGYMTNWIITQTDRFKVAASQRSISNRVSDFYYSDYSYDVTHENGVPRDDAFIKLSWDRSPIKFANNAKTPTLFIQSTQDYRCPFPEALQLFSALKWNGVEARLCGFKGENHELSRSGKPLHRERRLEEITNWIDSHIER